MKRNIVIISIFDLTRVSFEIAKQLEARGHHVSWITTNPFWTNWLRTQGVPEQDLLELVYDESDFLSREEKEELTPQIVHCEMNARLSVNQCLMMDQFVMYKNRKDINEFVYLYYRDIKRFLIEKKATDVFAEPTNINEMIAYMICRELNIRFLAPWDMRYPRNRLIFIEGYLQDPVVPIGNNASNGDGVKLLKAFEKQHTTPFYFEKHNSARVVSLRQLLKSAYNRITRKQVIRQNNLTHHDLSERILRLLRRLVNSFYMRRICKYDTLEEITGRVAFFGLHVQPEASIDVRGSYFSDQLKLIKDIRRALPFDVTLVVKEHPNFLGGRGYVFFRKVRKIPNVRLVRHDVSAFDIYEKADIVFTVSGTTAYEAGMLGIPAVTFSPMYFGGLSSVQYCEDITKLQPIVFKLLREFRRDYESDCRFMSRLYSQSHEGYWTNPLLDPSVLEPKNIENLTDAFVGVLEREPA